MSEQFIIELSNDISNIDALLVGITHVHASCIEHDKTQATFLPPLSYSKILKYWTELFADTTYGHRHIWVEVAPITSRREQLESPFCDEKLKPFHPEQDQRQDYEVSGVVILNKPVTETGAFRGEVLKLLVSPNHRRKGVAKRLMTVLERRALKEGRWSLVLGTEGGSPAEYVYPKFGYHRIGVIPENGYGPVEGTLCDEVLMYKNLKKDGTL